MQRPSLKMAPRHDRMYIIGLLACGDHFTTSITHFQTHTSRSPWFLGLEPRSSCLCERAPERRKTGHNAKPVLKRPGKLPTFSSGPKHHTHDLCSPKIQRRGIHLNVFTWAVRLNVCDSKCKLVFINIIRHRKPC